MIPLLGNVGWVSMLMTGAGAGPIWAAIAVFIVKGMDALQQRRKNKRDEMSEINSAHANLNKSLQGSLDALGRELRRIRDENEDLREILERRDKQIEDLEITIADLHRKISDHEHDPDA